MYEKPTLFELGNASELTLGRLTSLRKHGARSQEDLDNAASQARLARAEFSAARSKQLRAQTLKATIAHRQADVVANAAKLEVAQAELAYATADGLEGVVERDGIQSK